MSRSFGCKMMEAGLAFPVTGEGREGGGGTEGRVFPISGEVIAPRELDHWPQGHSLPFSSPSSHMREMNLLCAVIFSIHTVSLPDRHSYLIQLFPFYR